MARYDSPGFTDTTPAGPVNAQGYIGAGSEPPSPVPQIQGTTAESALVTPQGSGWQNADRVAVGPDDVLVPSQVAGYARDALSGVTGIGETGAHNWGGRTVHPNAGA